MLGLFAITERGRSWSSFYEGRYQGGLLSFSMDRVWAYYATATNNGVIYREFHAPEIHFPERTLSMITNAPGLGDILAGIGLVGPGDVAWQATLAYYGNPEFTNPGAILPILAEVGVGGAVLVFFAWGFAIGKLFAAGLGGSVAALCGYAGLCVGLLELARFPFFTSGRLVPGILAIAIIHAVAHRSAHRASGRLSTGGSR